MIFTHDQLEGDERRTKVLARDIQWLIVQYPTDLRGFRAHVEVDAEGLRILDLDNYTAEQHDRMVRDFLICFNKLFPPMADAV